jgi:hypothetical protein
VLGTGSTNVIHAAAGSTVDVSLTYYQQSCSCPGCVDQIQIGLEPGDAQACVSSQQVCQTAAQGNYKGTITAPTQPGTYDFRFAQGQDFSCFHTHPGWWTDPP